MTAGNFYTSTCYAQSLYRPLTNPPRPCCCILCNSLSPLPIPKPISLVSCRFSSERRHSTSSTPRLHRSRIGTNPLNPSWLLLRRWAQAVLEVRRVRLHCVTEEAFAPDLCLWVPPAACVEWWGKWIVRAGS